MGKINKLLKDSCSIGRILYYELLIIRSYFRVDRWLSDRAFINKYYKKQFGRYPNIDNPTRLTEFIQWLKLNVRKPIYTTLADKYAVRDYIKKKFGDEHLVPLLFETVDAKQLKPENIKSFPCIIKSNHDSGFFKIVKGPKDVNWKELRIDFNYRLRLNYFTFSREWPYKDIYPRRIIVEKLLLTKEEKLPNDYKLHYINGNLEFVYVSYDRQGINDRCVYDKDWNRMPFVWVPKSTYKEDMNSANVPCPQTFNMMKKYGSEIAKDFKYVRVDFYDVDGTLYFGEITLYHGSGMDLFFPDKYDEIYGAKVVNTI